MLYSDSALKATAVVLGVIAEIAISNRSDSAKITAGMADFDLCEWRKRRDGVK